MLIANQIPAGQGRSIFLHGLGSHLGLQRMLTERASSVRSPARSSAGPTANDNSLETRLAKRAVERVNRPASQDRRSG